jgi:hypothetical protein
MSLLIIYTYITNNRFKAKNVSKTSILKNFYFFYFLLIIYFYIFVAIKIRNEEDNIN